MQVSTSALSGVTGSGAKINAEQARELGSAFATMAIPPVATTAPTTTEGVAQEALQKLQDCPEMKALNTAKKEYAISEDMKNAYYVYKDASYGLGSLYTNAEKAMEDKKIPLLQAGTALQNSQAYKDATSALSALLDKNVALATSLKNATDLVPQLPALSTQQIINGINSGTLSKEDIKLALINGIKTGQYSKEEIQTAIGFMPEVNRAAATGATNAVFVSFANTLSDAKSSLQDIRNLMFGENGVARDYNKALNMINGLKSSLQDAGNPLKLQQESAVVNLNVIGALSNGIDANAIYKLLDNVSRLVGDTPPLRSTCSNGTSFAIDPGKIGTRDAGAWTMEAANKVTDYLISIMRDKLGGIVIGNTYAIDMSEFDFMSGYQGKQMVLHMGSLGGQPHCSSSDPEFEGLAGLIGTKLYLGEY